jgi:predicted O-linked N-acetylglucosamine transferase (SPINDLY family)
MSDKPILKLDHPQLQKAITLHQNGKFAEAASIYQSLLNAYPDDLTLLNKLGQLYLQAGNALESINFNRRCLEINPAQPFAWFYIALACKQLGRFEEAIQGFDQAISLHADFAEAYCNRGSVFQDLKRFEEALANFEQAIALRANYPIALNNRGIALRNLKRLAEAVSSFDQASAINPDFAEAYCYKGIALMDLGMIEQALQSYAKSLALRPNFLDALYNQGQAFYKLNQYPSALQNFEKALALKPDLNFMEGQILHTKLQICDWSGLNEQISSLAAKILEGRKAANPFMLHALTDCPAIQRRAAETWTGDKYPTHPNTSACKYPEHDKIRIGYFSADFRNHPVAFLSAELFELHDRNSFEITAFSFDACQVKDDMRIRLENGFDRFIDIRNLSDTEAVKLAKQLEIDIAVDLGGHTRDSRTRIFAMRAAPVQISYLGFLGTMAAEYMDYLFADQIVIPAEFKQHYAEKLVYLPSYQVNDSKRQIAEVNFSRSQLGLPEQGFVFCCFNNNCKFSPQTFASWMRILHEVTDSVLFLYAENPLAEQNLRLAALKNGIDDKRLIFAKRLPLPEYLARYRAADLFLDTLPYNAGTTASDALWAGLPVLTCTGRAFASRMAASLLTAIELPELIARSPSEYEALAIELAKHPEKLAAIKAKLAQNRLTTALFDTKLFTRNIETAYLKMYRNDRAGLAPQDIFV